MSNQESVFADQQQQYTGERVTNTDAREQQQWQEVPSQEPYRRPEEWQMAGEKLRPTQPPRRRRRNNWIFIALGVVVALLVLGALGIFALVSTVAPHVGRGTLSPVTKTIAVSGTPSLFISDAAGNVQIHRGDGSQVIITATTQIFGLQGDKESSNNALQVRQDGNDITIDTQEVNGKVLGFRQVNLNITVPQNTNIQELRDGSGNISLENFQGNINGESGSGGITLRDVSGQLKLQTGSGSINALGVNGVVDLSTGSGSISVVNSSLSGTSTLHSGSGSINFNGSLASTGSYQFDSGSGSINAALPANTSFHLDANSDSGDVHNQFGSSDVGSGQRANITMHSGSGSITLTKQD